jgi:hypothetical protein
MIGIGFSCEHQEAGIAAQGGPMGKEEAIGDVGDYDEQVVIKQ